MAITAETRQDIIELVVTAYNAAPGTTLLTELVAIIDGGGSLADVAANLTTREEWTSRYPSFQTAEEFAAEWLGNLVPEAGADALAEGISVATGLINGGASFGDILIEASTFLSSLAETDAAFGASAANFNNKVEVATYHTVTQETDGLDVTALASVTSDDDSVATAKAAVDYVAPAAGQTFALTTGLDVGADFVGGAADDTFSAVETAVTNPATDTLSTGDSLDGGAGSDSLVVNVSGSPANNTTAGVVTKNIENVKIFNNSGASADYTLDALLMTGVTDFYVNGGTEKTIIGSSQSLANLHLLSTSKDAEVQLATGVGTGTADAVTILSNGSALTADVDATYNGVETVNLALAGTTGSAALGFELSVIGTDLESIVITGSGDGNVKATLAGNTALTMTNTVDASAATGNNTVEITRGTGSEASAITMGAGDDHVIFSSTTSQKDTIAGGDGTDTLELSSDEDYGTVATAQDDLSGVSGFEVLRLQGGVDIDGRLFTNNTGLTTLVLEAAGSIDHSEIATVNHIGAGAGTVDLATDSATDTLAYNVGTATGAGISVSLTALLTFTKLVMRS